MSLDDSDMYIVIKPEESTIVTQKYEQTINKQKFEIKQLNEIIQQKNKFCTMLQKKQLTYLAQIEKLKTNQKKFQSTISNQTEEINNLTLEINMLKQNYLQASSLEKSTSTTTDLPTQIRDLKMKNKTLINTINQLKQIHKFEKNQEVKKSTKYLDQLNLIKKKSSIKDDTQLKEAQKIIEELEKQKIALQNKKNQVIETKPKNILIYLRKVFANKLKKINQSKNTPQSLQNIKQILKLGIEDLYLQFKDQIKK